MINLLDKALRRLREETSAPAAVVWSARAKAAAASVLTCSPANLLPAGAMWPSGAFGEMAAAELDAERLQAALPAALRDQFARPLHAARTFRLGNELFLTLMWCDPVPEAPEGPNPLIFDEISYLAGLMADSQFNLGEVERLRAVVNSLEDAVVTVDTVLGQASVNASAAELLTLPHGKNPASNFWAAVTDLSGRAVNWDEAGAELMRLKEDPLAQIESTLRFDDSPTHLKLISRAIHQPGFKGRTWVFRDESRLSQALASAETARDVLRASADGMLEPQALLEAVRDAGGAIVDFVYRDVNRAVRDYLGLSRDELIGRSLLETMPGLVPSGLLQRYAQCVETQEPLVLDEVLYNNEILTGPRYYDIRGNHVAGDSINLIWRDVTDRFIAAQRIAESEQHYRLLAENVGDTVIHVRDGHIAWISPGVEDVLGAPPQHWIGRQLTEIIPAEDRGAHEKVTWLSEDRAVIPRGRITAADGTTHWVHVHARTYYDADGRPDGYTSSFRIIDEEVRAVEAAEEARRRQAEADARYRRLMDNSAVPMCVTSPEGRFDVVNEAMCRYFGYDAETLRTKTWAELAAPEYLESDLAEFADMIAGKADTHRGVKEYFHADGHRIWGDLSVSCLRKPGGEVESIIAQIIDITEQVKNHRLAEEAQREEAAARARYRNLMDNAAVGMGVIAPDGRLEEVNQAACDFFGYDAADLLEMTWQELTAPEYMDADLANVENMMAGKIDSFRLTKQFIRADGHLIWGDLSVGCLRLPDGTLDRMIAQVTDITLEVETREFLARRDEQNRVLTARLQAQTDRLSAELRSAADYVESLLPHELDGPVGVSARYLPSRHLGGDCFDYRWIDDDHLIMYLMDVSGHGVAPALLSISVHNMLRSGSLPESTLLVPDRVLTELNELFRMDQHDDKYFTIWYGVYQASTRTLRYSNAGHPPPLLFSTTDHGMTVTELAADGMPIGMFPTTEFGCDTCVVQPESQLLLYSDGAFELPRPTGEHWPRQEFTDLCARLASTRDWSLDTLVDYLRARTTAAVFEDDCSLVRLDFP